MTRTPLYQGAAAEAARTFQPSKGVWGGNAGLWYDKFCNQWAADFSGLAGENAKRDWVESVVRSPTGPVKTGSAALLAEHARRREALVERQEGQILAMHLDSRFATGLGRRHPVENGFAWNHSLGVPYLAGAGVKGMVRAWATFEADGVTPKDIERIFGPLPGETLHVGSVIFLDALPTAPVSMAVEVMTPHTGPWNGADPDTLTLNDAPADWNSPNPVPYLVMEAGAVMQFAILPRTKADTLDAKQARDWLCEALSWLGAGAKTAIGFGRFSPADSAAGADPVSPFAVSRTIAARSAPAHQRGFVDGEEVRILRYEGDKAVVEFMETGDVETVRITEIKFL